MSYSGQTTHYGIPLPTSSDLVNLLDWNQSSEDIDAALYGAAQGASDAGTEIVGIKATLVQLENADVQFQSDLNAIDGRVTSLEQTSGNIEEDVEDIADMITAKEVPTAQSDQRILVDEWFRYNGVLYVCTVQIEIGDTIVPNVNCRATNIESEMAAGGGSVAAANVTLAPIAGMQATDVQDGISELNSGLGNKTSKYSGTSGGATYVTVDSIGYDSTNKKLGLKVNGADTVIPFSSHSSATLLATSNFDSFNKSGYTHLIIRCTSGSDTIVENVTGAAFIIGKNNGAPYGELRCGSVTAQGISFASSGGILTSAGGTYGNYAIPSAVYGINISGL